MSPRGTECFRRAELLFYCLQLELQFICSYLQTADVADDYIRPPSLSNILSEGNIYYKKTNNYVAGLVLHKDTPLSSKALIV